MSFNATDRNVGILLAVLLCMTLGLGAVSPGTASTPSTATAHGSVPAPLVAPAAHVAPATPRSAVVHYGDLIVTPANSPYIISPSVTHSSYYYQEGNVTVEAGATLEVENISFQMVQFIGSSGTVADRTADVFNFSVQGLAEFDGSTLTTDVDILDAFTKLTINITNGGTVVANQSSFLFPGWILVSGPGSHFYANSSVVGPNPLVSSLYEDALLRADNSYGPSLVETDQASVYLLGSQWESTYGENETATANVPPGITLQNFTVQEIGGGEESNWTAFQSPIEPLAQGLAEELGYPSMSFGNLTITYKAAANITATSDNALWIGTTAYSLGTLVFHEVNQTLTVPVPSSYITAVDRIGMKAYLQDSGLYSTTSSLNLSLGPVSGGLNVTGFSFTLTPSFPYNQVVVDSNFTAANSFLDLNWNATPSMDVLGAEPWGSHKLMLSDGSTAWFANVSVAGAYNTQFFNQSVVIPTDSASNAYFYRWGQFNVTSPAFGPIPGVQVSVFSGYPGTYQGNISATQLNNLAVVNPGLWTYVKEVTAANGGGTNITNLAGSVSLLLLSSTLGWVNLPDGNFVGSYHVATVIPGLGTGASRWFYASMTPYPQSMSPSTPDSFPTIPYTNYESQLTIPSVTLAVDGVSVSNATVAIGQRLNLTATITNIGLATVTSYDAALSVYTAYNTSAVPLAITTPLTDLVSGSSALINFSWVVNESTVGEHGAEDVTFDVTTVWNGGPSQAGGGDYVAPVVVHILPAYIRLAYAVPQGPYVLGNTYIGDGAVTFAGSGDALVNVSLTGGGITFPAGQGAYANGTFHQSVTIVNTLTAGSTYSLTISAFYNGRTVNESFTDAVKVQPQPSSSSGGIPWWVWVAIAAAVAIVAAFVAVRYLNAKAKPKLVECGECGQLIPESLTVCPKCGAEFEPDLVRCSRCAATIPAKSAICPECAATLLGTPGEEAKDPERQGYADFTEKYRAEGRKELGDNYSEGAFWDWWRRQPTYVSFEQWKGQQAGGSRAGMTAPTLSSGKPPAGGTAAAAAPAATPEDGAVDDGTAAAPAEGATTAAPEAAAASTGTMRACTNCGKEIPSDFLVCPFCGAVTR